MPPARRREYNAARPRDEVRNFTEGQDGIQGLLQDRRGPA